MEKHLWTVVVVSFCIAIVNGASTVRAEGDSDYPFETLVKSEETRNLYGIPSICRLKNGELFVVYHHLCHHACYGIHDDPWLDFYTGDTPTLTKKCFVNKGRLMGIRSSDEGRTWSTPFVVVDSPHSDSDPQVSTAPDGTVYLVYHERYWFPGTRAYWNEPHPKSPYPQYPRYSAVAIRQSTDGARSWCEPVMLQPFYEARDSCHDPIQFLSDGTLMMPIQGNPLSGKESGMMLVSHNRGNTWSVRGVVADPKQSVSEHAICQLGNGKLICAMRPGPFVSYSRDDGRTWTIPKELPDGPEKAPYFFMTAKRELLLLESTRRSGMGFTVRLSTDEGKTFSEPQVIDPTAANPHAQAVQLTDGTVLAVYYTEYDRNCRGDIRAARFRVAGSTIERLPMLP